MNTPIPIVIKAHRGIPNNLYVKENNIPTIKASLRTFELPVETITVSKVSDIITYRYCQDTKALKWGGWSRYAEVRCFTNGNNQVCFEYSGVTTTLQKHVDFMRSIEIAHPIICDIFNIHTSVDS